ncbi:unnamed protein product [Paramecium primaurelia]|uniref:Uncharacterized protein n=1 Tax=Paramecium primaurelia TaxID=5886 RepID=A0A8S1PKA1_PARPR|nr:unnamed protein product [Paramecium primaurelia]
MGTCQTRKRKSNSQNTATTPVSQFSNKIISYSQNCIDTKPQPKFVPQRPSIVEYTQYDPTNPHRQFNVLINGVHFEVINSVEEDILGQLD